MREFSETQRDSSHNQPHIDPGGGNMTKASASRPIARSRQRHSLGSPHNLRRRTALSSQKKPASKAIMLLHHAGAIAASRGSLANEHLARRGRRPSPWPEDSPYHQGMNA
jgi:hypothetical protein